MPVTYEKRERVGVVTLSRPEARNAWGSDFTEGLRDYFAAMEEDDDILCAVLTGDEQGRAFSAGAYIKDPQTHTVSSIASFVKSLSGRRGPFEVLTSFPKPLVAAVNGYAIGAGSIITFCCDLIVASERAEWRMPQVALGILPAYGGSARMARWVGRGNAMKLALGFPLSADEAYRIGLAQWLVPHEQVMEQAMEVADQLASLPPLAARLTKESLVRGQDLPSIADASFIDLYRTAILQLTEDKDEGHRAWREKRTPVFHGR